MKCAKMQQEYREAFLAEDQKYITDEKRLENVSHVSDLVGNHTSNDIVSPIHMYSTCTSDLYTLYMYIDLMVHVQIHVYTCTLYLRLT